MAKLINSFRVEQGDTALGRVKQEGDEFKASLGHIVKLTTLQYFNHLQARQSCPMIVLRCFTMPAKMYLHHYCPNVLVNVVVYMYNYYVAHFAGSIFFFDVILEN